jgi:exonuclease SbcD
MKILHTADVHLHTQYPQRMEALRRVLDLGRQENIDLMLIAGDLFDDHQQAEILRSEVRRLFSNLPYNVLTIPGNHDERAYFEESYYGSNFTALTDRPVTIRDFGEWRIVALPYGEGSLAPLLDTLKEAADPDKLNVLVLHCTWSLPHFSSQDYGGDQLRYLPVTEAMLTGLGYEFILAGHFHTAYRQRKLPCGAIFVYPGSPVSISSREQGRRSVNIVEAQGCRQAVLDTWYCQTLEYRVNMDAAAVLGLISLDLKEHPDELCALTVDVQGYIEESEGEFHQRLQDLVAGRVNTQLLHNYRYAGDFAADQLYRRFQERISREEDPQRREQLVTMLLDAFSQLLVEG